MSASKSRILLLRYFRFIMILRNNLVITLPRKLTSPVLEMPLQGSAMQYYKKTKEIDINIIITSFQTTLGFNNFELRYVTLVFWL